MSHPNTMLFLFKGTERILVNLATYRITDDLLRHRSHPHPHPHPATTVLYIEPSMHAFMQFN